MPWGKQASQFQIFVEVISEHYQFNTETLF